MYDFTNYEKRRGTTTLTFTLLGLLTSVYLGSAAVAQEAGGRPLRAPAEGPRIWWNQPRFVDGLALDSEQRGGMDRVLERHVEARREKGRSYKQARAEVARAAQAGDWEAAEAASVRLGEAAAELARLEGGLVVDVLRLLTAEQRAKLRDEFPAILRRPWLFGGPAGGRGFGP